ncbi:MAG: hypothetical protein K6T49_03845 [Acidobacterium ailaaui]|nr:hypothetical protein [Pseudacidobacterium ailaaui]
MMAKDRIAIILLCLACLVALAVAPWVDPPQTTPQALKLAALVMLAGLAASFRHGVIQPPLALPACFAALPAPCSIPSHPPLPQTAVLRC